MATFLFPEAWEEAHERSLTEPSPHQGGGLFIFHVSLGRPCGTLTGPEKPSEPGGVPVSATEPPAPGVACGPSEASGVNSITGFARLLRIRGSLCASKHSGSRREEGALRREKLLQAPLGLTYSQETGRSRIQTCRGRRNQDVTVARPRQAVCSVRDACRRLRQAGHTGAAAAGVERQEEQGQASAGLELGGRETRPRTPSRGPGWAWTRWSARPGTSSGAGRSSPW